MPISRSAVSVEKKRTNFVQTNRLAASEDARDKSFLRIGPALPPENASKPKRTHSSLTTAPGSRKPADPISLQTQPDGSVHIARTPKEKEKNPDKISLDRRGLTVLPVIAGESNLRLLSLQHNMLTALDAFVNQKFPFLVFLDIYDNQLERISSLEALENLRVLLIGKNRIKKIEGLQTLTKIEVLDLHGNQIQLVSGLSSLTDLKVLNLAGNQLRVVGPSDLQGLVSLQELNLRRNRLKKLLGFGETPQLQKLFISNNDIQTVEDMSSVAKAVSIKEIAVDNNAVCQSGDCMSFLVSYLPHLVVLNTMQVTEQVRKAANAWRRNKESSNTSFMELASDVNSTVRREEVISNARTNWELLRSQTKCLKSSASTTITKNLKPGSDFILTSLSSKPGVARGRCSKMLPHLARTSSQDTENSSSNASSAGELFRLPPILQQKMELVRNSGSLSSVGPNVDSSASSLLSSDDSTSSEDESNLEEIEETKVSTIQEESKPPIEESPPKLPSSSTDSSSNISSNITIPSSGSDLCHSKSSVRSRSIKSAVNHRAAPSKATGRAVTAAKAKPKQASPSLSSGRDREQGGDYLIEICGRHLNVFGQGGLRFIEKAWSTSKAQDVSTVNFNYVNFNSVSGVLCKIKQRFPAAESFVFKETNITTLGQLNALAEVQGLAALTIDKEGNPIAEKSWENYALYRLSHWGLKFINGREVTEEEVKAANLEYKGLSDLVLFSLPDVLLQPLLTRLRLDVGKESTAKKWLLTADPALRSVVSKEALQWKKGAGATSQEDLALRQKAKLHVGALLDEMSNTVNKLRLLDQQWPEILQESVRNTLLDYSHLNLYMKRKMQELK